MAKKSNQNKKSIKSAPVKQNVQPQQRQEQTFGKSVANIIGCVCLMAFIFFDELWVGTLACALAFAAYFVLQVFIEKSREWYASGYLYGTIGCLVLAFLEYQNHFISDLMGI